MSAASQTASHGGVDEELTKAGYPLELGNYSKRGTRTQVCTSIWPFLIIRSWQLTLRQPPDAQAALSTEVLAAFVGQLGPNDAALREHTARCAHNEATKVVKNMCTVRRSCPRWPFNRPIAISDMEELG